jgi:hypothetical protein
MVQLRLIQLPYRPYKVKEAHLFLQAFDKSYHPLLHPVSHRFLEQVAPLQNETSNLAPSANDPETTYVILSFI